MVRAIRSQLPEPSHRVLLLGVTPELANIAASIVAVDRSEMMIAKVWPGDTPSRHVTRDDWLTMELAPRHFSAAIGDGSFNAVSFPGGQQRLYQQLTKFIRPGGRIIFRTYLRPERDHTLEALVADASQPAKGSFHAFKWRLMMAHANLLGNANVPVAEIAILFDQLFPDRNKLAAASGWLETDIASIDVYRNSSEVYCFPTEAEFRGAVPKELGGVTLLSVGNYELAERCPIAVVEIPK